MSIVLRCAENRKFAVCAVVRGLMQLNFFADFEGARGYVDNVTRFGSFEWAEIVDCDKEVVCYTVGDHPDRGESCLALPVR